MSIEKDLSRIAEGVEQIVALLSKTPSDVPVAEATGKVEVAKVINVVKTAVEAVKKPVENVSTKSDAVEVKVEVKEPSDEDVRNYVRQYMEKTDKQKAIDLLIHFGAKAEKPMIKDVTDKVALVEAIKKALAAIESGS